MELKRIADDEEGDKKKKKLYFKVEDYKESNTCE